MITGNSKKNVICHNFANLCVVHHLIAALKFAPTRQKPLSMFYMMQIRATNTFILQNREDNFAKRTKLASSFIINNDIVDDENMVSAKI